MKEQSKKAHLMEGNSQSETKGRTGVIEISVDIVLQDALKTKCCSKTGKYLHCKVSTKASNSLTFFSWTANFSGNESCKSKEGCRSGLTHSRQSMNLKLPSKAKIPFLSHPAPLHCSGLPFPHAQESSGRIEQVTLRKALCPGFVYSAGRGGALGPSLVQFLQQMEHNSLLKSLP